MYQKERNIIMTILAAVAVPHPPIILPEVGKGEEQKIAHTTAAYQQAMMFLKSYQPETLIIISPHTTLYADYFHVSSGKTAHGDFIRFNAPQVMEDAEYDVEFVQELEKVCHNQGFPCGTQGEQMPELDHGTLIPLRFWHQAGGTGKIVRLGLSGLSLLHHYELGRILAAVSQKLNRRTVIIASGDLSHKLLSEGPYGFAAEGPVFDAQIIDIFKSADFAKMLSMSPQLCDAAGECGHRSFVIMAGAFDCKALKSDLLSYEGPFGVGYGVATFSITGDDASRNFADKLREEHLKMINKEDAYVRLARYTVEHFVRTGLMPLDIPQLLPEMLIEKAGVFVSLKKRGQLRGCIGTISPVQTSLALEIIKNAVSACSQDSRFSPVRLEELDELVYSVDVLKPAEPISSVEVLDAKKYGVIVQNGSRRGLLLPDLEGVETPAEQIAIAKQKAGILPYEEVQLSRFEVVRHK